MTTKTGLPLPAAAHDHFAAFRTIYSPDPEKLHALAHAKRFLERWCGDANFRCEITAGALPLSAAARACGCEVDVSSLRPVFHPDFVAFRKEADERSWPLTTLWDHFIGTALASRHYITMAGFTSGRNPDFDVWRARQMGRAFFDLGVAGMGIVHSPVAIELSSGCSVGCAFCGLTADRFRGHASLAGPGRQDWDDTISSLKAFFGDALKAGFLYWATDPLDNPEYIDFLDSWRQRVGVIPQTTTAIPLRDIELTRAVMRRWEEHRGVPNRFSILTTRMLREVHDTFTPEAMFGVELVLQNKGATTRKTRSGRPYIRARAAEGETPDRRPAAEMSSGTIACVTGFIINIRERTLKLVSPTMASERWPNGYVEFETSTYGNGRALEVELNRLRERHMKSKLTGHLPIRWSRAVQFSHEGDVVQLKGQAASIENKNFAAVGDLLQTATPTPMELLQTLTGLGSDPITVVGTIEHLWASGSIEHVAAELVPST